MRPYRAMKKEKGKQGKTSKIRKLTNVKKKKRKSSFLHLCYKLKKVLHKKGLFDINIKRIEGHFWGTAKSYVKFT